MVGSRSKLQVLDFDERVSRKGTGRVREVWSKETPSGKLRDGVEDLFEEMLLVGNVRVLEHPGEMVSRVKLVARGNFGERTIFNSVR